MLRSSVAGLVAGTRKLVETQSDFEGLGINIYEGTASERTCIGLVEG